MADAAAQPRRGAALRREHGVRGRSILSARRGDGARRFGAPASDRAREAEVEHESLAHKLGEQILTKSARAKEDETARRMFLLQYVHHGENRGPQKSPMR